MPGLTLIEKILSAHLAAPNGLHDAVRPGEMIEAAADLLLGNDITVRRFGDSRTSERNACSTPRRSLSRPITSRRTRTSRSPSSDALAPNPAGARSLAPIQHVR